MFQEMATVIKNAWQRLLSIPQDVYETVSNLNPTQAAVLWIQIIAGSLTVIWIIFQFAWMRRLNEARLEQYLENRIASDRDELAQERAETLAKLDLVSRRRGIKRTVLLVWANFRLAFSFILRMLSLGTVRGLADHTALLMQVGMLRRARRIYYDIAQDAMKKIKLYEDALTNRSTEAQNALIFAGRIAVLEGQSAVAVTSFKKAMRLKEDPDARLFIGRQLADPDPEGALKEYRAALAHASIGDKPATKAELHRSVAEIRMRQGRPGLARRELKEAQTLDEPVRDYVGLGKTEELLGDLYAPKAENRNAAENAYRSAIENFERAKDARRAQGAKRKLRNLIEEAEPAADGWFTRIVDRCAQALLRIVTKRRAQLKKKED